ncbi:hypothetical protein [Chondromyces apiculatus]|uniref:Uncharacterized protein n=1 Tax=Chondromyces apiculatus DSM 436 TaxID=1192034 RepID=A0A017SUZ0_9BACT|nr:hypothetical protein [Chondromyces apiculatus]EYF00818.1 Hypothetical protein CAP_8979 [Chondromyces apiculatus DSM 436]
MSKTGDAPLITPDGRYLVVRGRLWRCANPHLDPETREGLVRELMAARRSVGQARRSGDHDALREAGARVHAAKVALGERGPVWWDDGAPDQNRHLVRNTLYASWYEAVTAAPRSAPRTADPSALRPRPRKR